LKDDDKEQRCDAGRSPGHGAGRRLVRVATLLSFPLSHPGGISTFVRGLLGSLERDFRIDHRLIAPPAFTAGPGQTLQQVTLTLRHFLALARSRPHVVFNHEHAALLIAAVAYRLLVEPRARVIHTVHIQPVAPLSLVRRLVLGWLFGRCYAVTAVSRYTANAVTMIATPVPERIDVIHGAASIESRSSDAPEVAELRRTFDLGSGPIICQVGPLNFPMKVEGVIRLAQAMARVRGTYLTARLLVVGDGAHRGDLEAACERAGVSDIVRITGYLKDVTVPLAAAAIYCQMTLQDACPISLLEAMRSGKPIVAARTGGIPEIVADGVDGLLVDVEPDAIATALSRLLDHPAEAAALGHAAAARARRDFTWDRVAAQYAALLGLPRAIEGGGARFAHRQDDANIESGTA
jgi:glycosyltransferase involved in cell wall biosynthesis